MRRMQFQVQILSHHSRRRAGEFVRHCERNGVKRGKPETLLEELRGCGIAASWVAASRYALLAMTGAACARVEAKS
jgi:hypothetical protein